MPKSLLHRNMMGGRLPCPTSCGIIFEPANGQCWTAHRRQGNQTKQFRLLAQQGISPTFSSTASGASSFCKLLHDLGPIEPRRQLEACQTQHPSSEESLWEGEESRIIVLRRPQPVLHANGWHAAQHSNRSKHNSTIKPSEERVKNWLSSWRPWRICLPDLLELRLHNE